MRDDFSVAVKDTLALRVGMRCSNPACRQLTCGPRANPAQIVNIGVAAHITAAAPSGPRYDPTLSAKFRASIDNGIWLCQNCAKLVDNDTERFTVESLRAWKMRAEVITFEELQQRALVYTASVRPDLCFVTEAVNEADDGFRVQFSLANASAEGQINVFAIIPVLLYRHYLINYLEITPHALPAVTLRKLRVLRDLNPGTLLQSGDGIFSAGNLVRDRVYRLPPHEIETFTNEFLTVRKPPAIWALGYLVRFSDCAGNRRILPSDCVFVISNECGFSLAQYDLEKLAGRLDVNHDFDLYEDVTVGFDGTWRVPDEPTPPDDDGVVRIELDPDDMYEMVQGIPCDWRKLFKTAHDFLSLKTESWEEMKPT